MEYHAKIKMFVLLSILMGSIVFCENRQAYSANDTISVSEKKVDAFVDVAINGCLQKVHIQSNDVENNPILLYLHGGPGSSMMLYSYLYDEKLINNFIFVNWDQRGTAFSYHDGMDASKLSEEQIHDDALELIKMLMKKFNKKKIYLVGHSFGSVIGLQLAANHPEYFYSYIGVGQVAPGKWNESVAITYKWLHNKLVKADDRAGLERIEKNKFPYIDLVVKYGGHHRLSINLDSLRKSSPYYYDGYDETAARGKKFSEENVRKNSGRCIFANRSTSRIPVPLFFFEGVNDHVTACPPELVIEYCKNVTAPSKQIIWFNNSAHLMNIEEPEKFQDELIRVKNTTYIADAP